MTTSDRGALWILNACSRLQFTVGMPVVLQEIKIVKSCVVLVRVAAVCWLRVPCRVSPLVGLSAHPATARGGEARQGPDKNEVERE